MATISYAVTRIKTFRENSHVILWETLTTTNDTGSNLEMPGSSDRSVQVIGSFGAGGTLVIQGSNDNGTTWHTLNDPQGNALSFTTAKTEAVLELTRLIRPFISGGDGTTDLDVYMLVKR